MSFFISPAYADAVGGSAAGGPSGLFSMLLPLGFIAIMYFMLIRPQQKRAKEQQELVSALAKGDEVVFAGGLLGRITRLDDDYAAVEIKEGVEIKVQRATITATLPKGTLKNI